MDLRSLFPDADYRHHLGLKRGDLQQFFAPTAEHDSIIAERRHWIAESPAEYLVATDDAEPVIAETAAVLGVDLNGASDSLGQLTAIGTSVEPDIVLLKRAGDGVFRVVGGCVCFPSSWSLPEKLGMPLDHVHSIVPNLNATIGQPISRFLDKLQPGAAWERSNWGLSAVPDRNQHPGRQLPRLTPAINSENVWLRVEDQILAFLPQSKGLLFGLRITTQSFAHLRSRIPAAAAGLRRALETMPEEMARYKNIAPVRAQLVQLLS